MEMKHRGERGGKRYRQRKAKAMGMDDVEMQEVEVCLKMCVAVNAACTLHLPQNAALLSPILRLGMVHMHLLIGLFCLVCIFAIQHSFVQICQD